jgi:hypothetical protein
VIIPWDEWETLVEAMRRDHPAEGEAGLEIGATVAEESPLIPPPIAAKLVRIAFPGGPGDLVTSRERLPEILCAFDPERRAAVGPFPGSRTSAGPSASPPSQAGARRALRLPFEGG